MRWCGLAAISVVLLTGSAAPAFERQSHKWWQSDRIKAAIALTDAQSDEIEAIFQATLPKLRTYKEELDRLEAELSKLVAADDATEGDVARQVDRVEAARSRLGKTRTLMLFKMHRVLTPEQRDGLHALQKERDRNRR